MNGQTTGVTVLKDESLGGTLREYREVKRKANVGETVIMTEATGTTMKYGRVVPDYHNGDTFVIESITSGLATSTSGKLFYHREYSVLEPSDILRINSERFRMVDRKAAVGERVIVVAADSQYYSVGNIAVVIRSHGDIYADLTDNVNYYGDGHWYVNHAHYAVLEPQTTPLSALPLADQYAENITVLTRKIAQLEKRNTALEGRILALETDSSPAYVKVASGPVDITLPSFSKAPKSAQQIRDEIVERAKGDVGDLRKFSGKKIPNDFVSFWPKTELPHAYIAMHTVEFVVNSAKRTVAVIIRCTEDGLTTRGITKCAPGETFNAHIGRAIVLYRALGLNVPAEYLTCPQPEKVRVGDHVTFDGVKQYGTVYVVTSLNKRGPNLRIVASSMDGLVGETAYGGDLNDGKAILLDDSREDGGNSAASSALKGAA